MEERNIKVRILGTNQLFNDLRDKEFFLEKLVTNPSLSHVLILKNFEEKIFFDQSAKIKFLEEGIWIEGFAQIENGLGNLSVLIETNATNAII
jgi:regulation of enolase protein 1 (concanavalin A-like superfamily)